MSISIEHQRAIDPILEGLCKRIRSLDCPRSDSVAYAAARLCEEVIPRAPEASAGCDVLPPIAEALTDVQFAAMEKQLDARVAEAEKREAASRAARCQCQQNCPGCTCEKPDGA